MTSIAGVKLSRHGDAMLQELPLHDASFDGIVAKDRAAALQFTRTNGQRYEVRLIDVSALQMNDFREGNTVLFFEAFTGDVPRADIGLERLFPAPHPSAAEEHHLKHAVFIKAKLHAIETGSLTIVEMQSVYGADLIAACKSIIVTETAHDG